MLEKWGSSSKSELTYLRHRKGIAPTYYGVISM